MEDSYLMYTTDRRNTLQKRELLSHQEPERETPTQDLTRLDAGRPQHERQSTTGARLDSYEPAIVGRGRQQLIHTALDRDMSETEFTGSDIGSSLRGTPSRTRARLDSYEQAHLSRERLQNMEDSYRRRSHNDLFLDEKTLMKRKRIIWAMCGIITILIILLLLLLGAIAGVSFIIWNSQLAFAIPSFVNENTMPLRSTIDTEQIHQFMNETNIALDDYSIVLQHLLDVSFSNLAAIDSLNHRISQLTEATERNFSSVNTALNTQASNFENYHSTTDSRFMTLENNDLLTDTQFSTLENNLLTTEQRLTSFENTLRAAQNNISLVNNQASSLQTSINTISNRISSPVNLYQNCRQYTTACNITSFRDTRLYCSTSALIINLQNYFTVDIRCDFGLGLLNTMEAPSLLRQESTEGEKVFCQCSMVHPTATGHVSLANPFQIITCTMTIIRCPISQTVFT